MLLVLDELLELDDECDSISLDVLDFELVDEELDVDAEDALCVLLLVDDDDEECDSTSDDVLLGVDDDDVEELLLLELWLSTTLDVLDFELVDNELDVDADDALWVLLDDELLREMITVLELDDDVLDVDDELLMLDEDDREIMTVLELLDEVLKLLDEDDSSSPMSKAVENASGSNAPAMFFPSCQRHQRLVCY